MYNGHNNDWEYVEQIPTSHQYGNEYQDENEDNADEPYEIESDFIEEEFEYDYDTIYPGRENDSEKKIYYPSSSKELQMESGSSLYAMPPQPSRCLHPQSAPGYISHQGHSSSLETQEFDEDYSENENHTESTANKFLNCTNDCGSEELFDSKNYETLVLYANYNTRNLNGPKEYYSSESEQEIIEFVESAINKRKRKTRRRNGIDRPNSGYSLTTRHKGPFSFPLPREEDIVVQNLNSNLQGFGQAHVMRPILTLQEQQMLGIIPNHMDCKISKPLLESETLDKKPTGTKIKTRTTKLVHPSNMDYFPSHVSEYRKCNDKTSGNSSRVKNLRKHNAILRVESIKVVPYCEDPSAAGDSAHNVQQKNDVLGTGRRPKYDLENREIISATHSFKEAVQLHLPQQPQFRLGDKFSSSSFSTKTNCLKGIEQVIKCNSENSSKSIGVLSGSDKCAGGLRKDFARDTVTPVVASLPNMNLHKSYKSPIPPRRSPIRHVITTNCSPRSWNAVGHNVPSNQQPTGEAGDLKLSQQFQESCLDLWLHKLQSSDEDEPLPPLPSRTQSETKDRKSVRRDLTTEKKIQFTYTSHESFFVNTTLPTDTEPLHNLQGFGHQTFLRYSGSDNSSTNSIKICPGAVESDPQETFTVCSSSEDIVSPISDFDIDDSENCSSTDGKSTSSSSSSLNFIVFPKTPNHSRSNLDSAPNVVDDIPTIPSPQPLLDSTSYTILEHILHIPSSGIAESNSEGRIPHASDPSPSQDSDHDFVNTSSSFSSNVSESSFTRLETPPRPPNSDDSADEGLGRDTNDGFCSGGVTLADKMAFKFVLDEIGSEVVISVTLPFPVPSPELPNIWSPYMAASVLQKARELVLQNVGFNGCGDYVGGYGSDMIYGSEWMEQGTEFCLPILECSISMEELLHRSPSYVGRYESIDEAQERTSVSWSGTEDTTDTLVNTKGRDQHCTKNSKFIRFFSSLFLCRWCRNGVTKPPENAQKSDCDNEDNKI